MTALGDSKDMVGVVTSPSIATARLSLELAGEAGPNPQSELGGCQNCGPFSGTLNIRCRIIIGIQEGTIILTTTQLPQIIEDSNHRRIVGTVDG